MVKSYWKSKWEKQLCGITKTRLRPGKNKNGLSYVIFLHCNHGFYRSVLKEWIKHCPTMFTTCPTCRRVFENILSK